MNPLWVTLLVSSLYLIQCAEADHQGCPGANWHAVGRTCFQVNVQRLNYGQAAQKCTSQGGYLVEIKNPDVERELRQTIHGNGYKGVFWIGVRDPNKDRKWNFFNGEPVSKYTAWAKGEPNNVKRREYCVEIWPAKWKLYWNDEACDLRREYICQAPRKIDHEGCPGDNWHGIDNNCYQINAERLNYGQAAQKCTAQGGYLVELKNANVEKQVRSTIHGWGYKGVFWIGVRDPNKDKKWNFFRGEPVTNYHPWAKGEPNNAKGREHCVEIWPAKGQLYWNDEACDLKTEYICQAQRVGGHQGCPDKNWYAVGDSCFQFHDKDRETFETAGHACLLQGGNLAVIDDANVEKGLRATIQYGGHKGAYWVGLVKDTGHHGQWRFVNGQKVTNFHPWAKGEPNNAKGRENCVEIWPAKEKLYWNDEACDSKRQFICERARITLPPIIAN